MYEVYLKQFGERGSWAEVVDSVAASRVVRAFIDREDIGASVWEGGNVRKVGGKKVLFRVSYNGRVWDARPFPKCQTATF